MKVRIKFSKQGAMKFIGHLDIMRYFQKAIRRAGIEIVFSEGFSPHMVMSFAAPLGVGLTSSGEYMDIEVKGEMTSQEAVRRLNACMAEGIEVLSYRKVQDGKAGKAMSLVTAADYTLTIPQGVLPFAQTDELEQAAAGFLAQNEITILKKTKKSEKEVDIKNMIYRMEVLPSDGEDQKIFMCLATGSAQNLKPELVMEAFASFAGTELLPYRILINREEVYAEAEDGNSSRQLISLEDLGEEIV